MGTYRTLLFQCMGLAVCITVLVVLAPVEARVWVLACGAVALAFFIVVSVLRHRQIKRLAHEIDQILHSGRSVDLSDYREGDVAVLSNELAKMVARLDRANSLLESERNALADALADVSHQIRTPLTAAALMLPKIERAEDEAERNQAMHELEQMIERISWLVTSLLKIAKVDAGAICIERKPVDVQEMVHRASAPLMVALDLHDVQLVVDVDAGMTFEGDMPWTTEAVENILKNCMEHTPPGGTITFRASEDALACRITITDTGPGFAPEELTRIFERFYRGQNHEGVTQGFGIGLALAQALISAQDGTLVASNGAKGSARFDIAFPKLVV